MRDKVVAVIHAKGISERLTRKNFCLIGGVPLFLAQAQNISNLLPKSNIYIDSEDEEILILAELCGFRPLQRDPKKASKIMKRINYDDKKISHLLNKLSD